MLRAGKVKRCQTAIFLAKGYVAAAPAAAGCGARCAKAAVAIERNAKAGPSGEAQADAAESVDIFYTADMLPEFVRGEPLGEDEKGLLFVES